MSTSPNGRVRILIVRHGETDCNVQGIIQGQLDTDLNKVGRKQAEYVGAALQSEAIDEVYTSPSRRAKDTADAIVAAHPSLSSKKSDGTYWLDDRLKERGFGSLEGKTFDRSKPKRDSMDGIEQTRALTERLASFLEDVLSRPAPFASGSQTNGTSASDWEDEPVTRPAICSKRVTGNTGLHPDTTRPHLDNQGYSRTILFVSHGAAISALLGLMLDLNLAMMAPGVNRSRIWNCSITSVTADTSQLLSNRERVELRPMQMEASQRPFIIEQWADVRHIPASIDDAVTKTGNADEMVGK